MPDECLAVPPPTYTTIYKNYGIYVCRSSITNEAMFWIMGYPKNIFNFIDEAKAYIDNTLIPVGLPPVAPPPIPPPPPPDEEPIPDEVPIPTVTVTGFTSPTLPWYVAWLKPVIDFGALLTESVVNHLFPFGTNFSSVIDFFKNPVKAITDRLASIFIKSSSESGITASRLFSEIREGTPSWAEDLKGELGIWQELYLRDYWEILDTSMYIKPDMTGEQSAKALKEIATRLVDNATFLFEVHSLIESGSLGQFEWVSQLDPMVLSKFGFNSIVQAQALLPYQKGLMVKTEQYYNSKYPYQIPTYTDLINMVVKEVISLDTFKDYMLLIGYDTTVSQYIWDAHFFAPSLGNLLTSYRRGTITEERLVELQILVDLDPRYNEIWHDSWYNDPTPRQARFMFETGAIDRARLRNIVERTGLLPDDVEPFTEYLATFNERQWKRRYVIEVARGYRLGKITEDKLRTEILKTYHSVGVADWIVATEEVAKIIEVKEPKPPKVKLLTVADWKKAYIQDKIDRDKLNMELLELNYEQENIDILIATIDEDKVAKKEGAKIVRLTKGEMLQAFKQEEIDEDDLRTYLLDIGLEMLEANILINTKKKQWGLGEE